MNQKGIAPLVIVVIIVVVAVVAGVGIYVATRGGGGAGGGGAGGDIASATSLSFNADFTFPTGSTGGLSVLATLKTNKWKDIGSVNMKTRGEGTVQGQTVIYIVNGEQRKVWVYMGGQWTDLSENHSWDEIWDEWCGENGIITEYQIALSGWTGGEYTYTDPTGTSIRFYDIELNPTLDDSLFVHSA